MMDMVANVGKAICIADRGVSDECKTCRNARYRHDPVRREDVYVELPEGCLGLGYERSARAAIAAMREPTPEMVEACDDYLDATYNPVDRPIVPIGDIWRPMIEAALASPQP